MRTPETCRQLPELADTVWAERALVERLLYKLVSAKLILAADERPFVGFALQEVEAVVDDLWKAERNRDVAVHRLAEEWALHPEEITLGRIVAEAPEPWSSMFADHHDRLGHLAREIESTAAENRRLAALSLEQVRESLGSLTGDAPQTYTATGRAATGQSLPTQVSRSL